ncbi:hypothetical protein E2C01_070181 [Portunus trituberculatus]|uniref:Uncharacterized protein n=1 Tax=Portunus trituberculatus TaxID=210409 RepID=A0A5B7I1F8_PORTR|nr:hypothetical protein [Portunus trituberculatus]
MTVTISFKALSSLSIMMILLMVTLSSLKPENSLSLLHSSSCFNPRGVFIISLLVPLGLAPSRLFTSTVVPTVLSMVSSSSILLLTSKFKQIQ